jgi:hypothetical protein
MNVLHGRRYGRTTVLSRAEVPRPGRSNNSWHAFGQQLQAFLLLALICVPASRFGNFPVSVVHSFTARELEKWCPYGKVFHVNERCRVRLWSSATKTFPFDSERLHSAVWKDRRALPLDTKETAFLKLSAQRAERHFCFERNKAKQKKKKKIFFVSCEFKSSVKIVVIL